jgi:D-arabinonate dehydratase
LEPLLIGESALDIQAIHNKLIRALTVLGLQWGAIGPIFHSISGIDMALWDLLGKHKGQSVAKLLGGSAMEQIPVYASGLGSTGFEELVEKHQDMGVSAYKLKVGRDEELDFRNLQTLRSMLKPDDRLMIDANQSWNREDAVRILKRFEPFRLGWIEEPVRCDDFEGQRLIREQVSIPVAAGENIYGVHYAQRALDEAALDIIQPDLCKTGGITECRAVAELAISRGVPYALHYLSGAVCLAASVHFMAGVAGGRILELDANPNPFREKLFTEPLTVKDGCIQVPDRPGLGFELDEDFVAFYQVKG